MIHRPRDNPDYHRGYSAGLNGRSFSPSESDAFLAGYDAGERTRLALKKQGFRHEGENTFGMPMEGRA